MEPKNNLVEHTTSYCLAKESKAYAMYAEGNANQVKLNLGNLNQEYIIQWYNQEEVMLSKKKVSQTLKQWFCKS